MEPEDQKGVPNTSHWCSEKSCWLIMKLHSPQATKPSLLLGSWPDNQSIKVTLLMKIQRDWAEQKVSPEVL